MAFRAKMLLNEGGGNFLDVGPGVGLGEILDRQNLSAGLVDVDNDGLPGGAALALARAAARYFACRDAGDSAPGRAAGALFPRCHLCFGRG